MERNWVIEVNLEGVAPADLFVNVGEGAYRAKTAGSGQKDNGNIVMDVVITEPGDFEGLPSQLTLGTNFSKGYNAQKLKGALISMGAKEESLSGHIKIEARHVAGKDCYLYFGRLPEEGELDDKGQRVYQQRDFISAERYEQIRSAKVTVRGRAKTTTLAAVNGGERGSDFQVVQPSATGPLAGSRTAPSKSASPFG